MTEQLEHLLRETFTREAEEAPPALDLASTVRASLRRRRQRLARIAVAAVAVLGLGGGIAWEVLQPGSASGPAGRGGTVQVVPQPSASDPCPIMSDCDALRVTANLRRPLHLPQLAAGSACPVSASRQLPGAGGFSGPFTATGPGPVYMAGGTTISFDYPPKSDSSYYGTGWGGQKVIWAIDKDYSGPLLFRGARLDGPQALRFDHYLGTYGGDGGNEAFAEMAYPPLDGITVMRTAPSGVRMQAGCCQVDGTNFSEIIVFRAELTRS